MPHIIVEYTDTLENKDVPKLVTKLHDALAAQETVNLQAIKSRAVPVKYTVVGDGHQADKFIHITVKLLPGRDNALKKTMAAALFETAKSHIKDESVSLSVEIAELHAESYTK